LEFWLQAYAPNSDIKLQRLVLTHAQVTGYQLSRIPIKDTDKGKRGFEERYGEDAVELDALQALRPGTLAQLVRAAIAPYRDETMQDRFMEVRHEAREAAEQAWAEQTAASRAELATIEAAIDGKDARTSLRELALQRDTYAEGHATPI
jgi:hypothetical protein